MLVIWGRRYAGIYFTLSPQLKQVSSDPYRYLRTINTGFHISGFVNSPLWYTPLHPPQPHRPPPSETASTSERSKYQVTSRPCVGFKSNYSNIPPWNGAGRINQYILECPSSTFLPTPPLVVRNWRNHLIIWIFKLAAKIIIVYLGCLWREYNCFFLKRISLLYFRNLINEILWIHF